LIERDPLVIELLRKSTDFETWPGIGKLRIEITDALNYLPDCRWITSTPTSGPRPASRDPDMQIQANVRARQVGWWGQELLFLNWLNGGVPTLENYRAWANELSLPLIEQDNPAYPVAIEQVSKSYFYRMFQNELARTKSVQPA
jgi:hypothetical protein